MFPVIARLGSFTFYTYTVLVDLGIVAGLAWLYWRAPQAKKTRWVDAGLAAAVGGLIGARLLYVLVNAGYYADHAGEVLQFWRGGLAWPGAAFGAWLGMWLYSLRRREPLAPIWDALAVPAAVLSLLSWGGCLAAGCAYGYEVAPGEVPAWVVSNAPDMYGLVVPRWPTQALGAAWSLAALGMIWGMRQRGWPAGALGAYAVSLVALGAFGLGFTRADPVPVAGGFRLDVIGGAVVLVSASSAWAWRLIRARLASPSNTEPLPHS